MIVALEGNVYTGKTTFLRQLSSILAWPFLPEQTFFLNALGEHDRKLHPENWMEKQQRYLQAEVQRRRIVDAEDVLLDRSFLSMAVHVSNLYHLGIADIRNFFLQEMISRISNDEVLLPDAIVWLHCSYDVICQRARHDPWRGTDSLLLRAEYQILTDRWRTLLLPTHRIFSMDTSHNWPDTCAAASHIRSEREKHPADLAGEWIEGIRAICSL